MEGPELCRMWAWCRMMNCQQNVYSLRAVLKANQWAELHKKIIFISRSKWYSRLPFTALKPFVLNIYCKFGEAVTVLSVTHGYSEVCCKGSGGNDGWMFSSAYGNIKAPCNGKRYLRKAEAHKLTAGHTHTCIAHTDNCAQLVWRQPLRVSFLFEEPNFYQYRFGLLWENSSWPCSHSSLWASQGLVNRLYKFPCLYSLQPSPPPATNSPYLYKNATANPNLSCVHVPPTLLSQCKRHSWIQYSRRILKLLFWQTIHNVKRGYLFFFISRLSRHFSLF